ncbi:ferredoxin reductase family protein [Alteromonas sp. 14N.309.X.WAT.G.H12]|uniref:ferredoxin reductase family protein n=1 Tax=Alteromonas sp. 14N.309.X.WAT.G.H12 TaxID=3120824 RepID=UPI002FCF9D63
MITSNNLPASSSGRDVTKPLPVSYKQLTIIYMVLLIVPWVLSFEDGLAIRGLFQESVVFLTIVGMTMMYLQFLFSTRHPAISNTLGIDQGMRLHRKMGEWLGLLFFLHPLLILAPRFWLAPQLAWGDLWSAFSADESLTGLIAWFGLIIWVLMSMFKEKVGLSYEAWRYGHSIGFVAIIILATHHAVTVGRHGRYDPWFDVLWISLCCLAVGGVIYNYTVRPMRTKRQPFKVVDCHKAGTDDWCLTIEKDGDFDFRFDAGQFVWLSSADNAFNRREHPFSIASAPSRLPQMSFIIRALGDYTRNLDQLKPGMPVHIEGPHGAFTLNNRVNEGIALIAGGAGIGPILGILRSLREQGDKRPIRLIYGNRNFQQCVFQEEIEACCNDLDFKQILVLENPPSADKYAGTVYSGFINPSILTEHVCSPEQTNWDYYICGPKIMVHAVEDQLKSLNVANNRIIFEALSF